MNCLQAKVDGFFIGLLAVPFVIVLLWQTYEAIEYFYLRIVSREEDKIVKKLITLTKNKSICWENQYGKDEKFVYKSIENDWVEYKLLNHKTLICNKYSNMPDLKIKSGYVSKLYKIVKNSLETERRIEQSKYLKSLKETIIHELWK